MLVGDLQVGLVCHTTFLFGTANGTVLLTDPYFSGEFEWMGIQEQHLQCADIRPESITRCDAVFVSHAHPDHCDLNAIATIAKQTGARIIAPPDVSDLASAGRVEKAQLIPVHDGLRVEVGEMRLEILGAYDNSFDAQGRMNKFSLLIRQAGTSVWFSGDCHALPPGLRGQALDAVFCWTSPDVVEALSVMKPAPRRFVMMHHDRHRPGNFWCSRDVEKDTATVSAKLPGIEVIVPDRLGSFHSFLKRRYR